MQIPKFNVVFRISAPIRHDITMKSSEIVENCSSCANKGCDPKNWYWRAYSLQLGLKFKISTLFLM